MPYYPVRGLVSEVGVKRPEELVTKHRTGYQGTQFADNAFHYWARADAGGLVDYRGFRRKFYEAPRGRLRTQVGCVPEPYARPPGRDGDE
jgi:hypothetical protein